MDSDAPSSGAHGNSPQHSVLFPPGNEVGMRSLSLILQLMGCSILAYCFAMRSHREDFISFRGLRSVTWARWLILLVFLDSWIFVFLAGVLVNGVGMSLTQVTCELGIFLCIAFYALSKIFIYLFLIEKVCIVWPNPGKTRWTSTAYRVCLVSMTGYLVIVIIMIIGRIAYLQDDGQCIIGLGKVASLSLLLYDLLLNVFLTGMFLYPLYQNRFLSPKLRSVARRTLAAATMALITSAVNITVLTILHGQEFGWVCLASCGSDTMLNAVVIFWVTGSNEDKYSEAAAPTPVSNGGAGNSYSGVAHFSLGAGMRSSVKAPGIPLTPMSPTSADTLRPPHTPQHGIQGHDLELGDRKVAVHSGDSQVEHEVVVPPRRRRHRRVKPQRQGFLTKISQFLGFGDDNWRNETQSMSVQVTVTTQTDVIDYMRPPRSDSISTTHPLDKPTDDEHLRDRS